MSAEGEFSRRTMLVGGLAAFGGAALAQAGSRRLYRQVPRTGERIPIVGLGTYVAFDIDSDDADWDTARQALDLFLARGGRMIDSSPMYGRAEAAIGTLLGGRDAFVATKVWTADPDDGRRQIEHSFDLLQRPRLDLLQIHNLVGYETHLPFLRTLKERGRIRYIGATHYNSGGYAGLERAIRGGIIDFIQVNYSVGERDAERRLLALARDSGVAVIVNRPFAGGNLFARVRALPLPGFAAELNCRSWSQLLLKYVLADSSVTCAIPGTRNPRHVLDNLGAALPPLPDLNMRRRILAAALG